ncbi:MAG: phosphoribosylformylglycinamidine synthase subunit PurL [Dehalococcoidia bacterium]|nr:phosphoribosylformylglycinamidine synthase subunit PurL [Dehalococcoidia bacterium]
MPVPQQALDDVALSLREYDMIVKRLGREPNLLELGMFGSLWSEHCGYKHSKALLRTLPSKSPRVLVAPGEENAGAVDIGDGLAITMKIESHNHPSAIEPYQGAATGVGGIVRDIFTMGARPIALLNSLRFGPLSVPRNRYLFHGVVGGISAYGNCLGIPNVGGEVVFADCYSENPLVNAMCVGIINKGGFVPARATGPGNPIMIVGADTGRDGIHGASGLASRAFEETKELRSAVQVGNPFLEKCLIEACLELAVSGHIVGMQDLGAAGLTSAAIESAHKGHAGLRLDVAAVPRREQGMTPYEVMLSESQERMLVVVKKGHEDGVHAILRKWDLESAVIGEVTADDMVRIYDGPTLVMETPIAPLADPPEYRPAGKRPAWLDRLQAADFSKLPLPSASWSDVLLCLLASPNIAGKESVYRQYDHQVIDNTVIPPGADAALLRIKGTSKGIALVTDGNGRFCYLNPHDGGAIAIAEACRNLVCVGTEPIALTDGLNFGNPERPEVYYQMEQVIAGMADACRALDVPIISGNVSLYNETRGEAIYPTPIVGALGLTENIERRCTPGFKRPGDLVLLLGDPTQDPATLGGSEYLATIHGKVEGMPRIDLDLERRVQRACLEAVQQGVLASAHDCSDGGLAVALAESAIAGNLGFTGNWPIAPRAAHPLPPQTGEGRDRGAPISLRPDAALFGEAQSRIVVSIAPESLPALQRIAHAHRVPLTPLGHAGGDTFAIANLLTLPLDTLRHSHRTGLDAALQPL